MLATVTPLAAKFCNEENLARQNNPCKCVLRATAWDKSLLNGPVATASSIAGPVRCLCCTGWCHPQMCSRHKLGLMGSVPRPPPSRDAYEASWAGILCGLAPPALPFSLFRRRFRGRPVDNTHELSEGSSDTGRHSPRKPKLAVLRNMA